MKRAVITDIHGRPLTELEDVFSEVDSLICLGDFDHPGNIEEFMDFRERLVGQGREVIIVPGNHDHAIFYNIPIHSGTLRSNGWNVEDLHHKLHLNYPRAKEFMQGLLEDDDGEYASHGVETELFDKPSYIVHGGLAGDMSCFNRCPEGWQDLWFRILWSYNPSENFEKMEEQGYDLLVRGHDHERAYNYQSSSGKSENVLVAKGGKFDLVGERQIINPGAWFSGKYLVLDEEERTLDFRDVGEWSKYLYPSCSN